jgi:predicted DNA binding protein
MRRLIMEIPETEFSKLEKVFDQQENNSPLRKIKSSEILHILRLNPDEFAVVVKTEFNGSFTPKEGMIKMRSMKIQVLEQDKNGAFTYFISGKFYNNETRNFILLSSYLSEPMEIKDGKIKIAFIGDEKQLQKILVFIDGMGINYGVVALSEAEFSSQSPLRVLTEKQRKVLVYAFEHGYYETPRKVRSQELAKKLNLKTSTFVEHRRKAERRLLSKIIKES